MSESFPHMDLAATGLAPAWMEGVVEVPVLLSRRQVEELERAARRRGITTGQLLRRLLADFLREDERPA